MVDNILLSAEEESERSPSSFLGIPLALTTFSSVLSTSVSMNRVIHDVYHYGPQLAEETMSSLKVTGALSGVSLAIFGVAALINCLHHRKENPPSTSPNSELAAGYLALKNHTAKT